MVENSLFAVHTHLMIYNNTGLYIEVSDRIWKEPPLKRCLSLLICADS